MRVPTIQQLIADHGVHTGTQRRCSCCNRYMLFRIPCEGNAGWFIACNYCDTGNE